MKRDMDLVRNILFAIEEQYVDSAILNLRIEGYEPEAVSYHCGILYDAGYLSTFNSKNADNKLWFYGVGRLTWEGHEFLDKIRSDIVWNKTKETVTKHGLPMVLDVVKSVATTIISSMTEGAIKSLNP